MMYLPESHTREWIMSFKLTLLSSTYFSDCQNYWKDITTCSLTSFSSSECATFHHTWGVVEYSGGSSPWCTSCRDPHTWRSASQHGQNCLLRHRNTVGLRKYHNGICDVGVEGCAEQSEVRKFWMYEIKGLIILNTSVAI